jgi:hypothetical protein
LVGHGLKASLPWNTVGVLNESEANWMANHFSAAANAYNNMLMSLEPQNVTFDIMRNIPALNTRVSNMLREAAIMTENTVRGRFVALNSGLNRRQKQLEQKRPIRERLLNMDLETKLRFFNPLFLRGRQFRLPEDVLAGLDSGDPRARQEVLADANTFCNVEQDPQLKDLALSWFSQAIVV